MSPQAILKVSALVIVLSMAMGCGKKVTKVDETPQKQTQTEPEYKATDPDSFAVQEPESRLKDLLVPIYFDYDQFTLRRDGISSLEKIAYFVKKKIE